LSKQKKYGNIWRKKKKKTIAARKETKLTSKSKPKKNLVTPYFEKTHIHYTSRYTLSSRTHTNYT
jgi:hypothetical protein